MSVVGADVPAIRTFVQQLNQRSAAIAQITAQLTTVIAELPWVGNDRERFLKEWNENHHPGLLQLLADLGDAAVSAGKAADDQEAASADHFSGGGGGGGRGW